MKKVISVIVAGMMSLVVASCGGSSNSSDADRISQLEDSIANLNNKLNNGVPSVEVNAESNSNVSSVNTSENDAVGTYEFTDSEGHKFILTLNDDETAQIKINDLVRYGSWEKYSPIEDNPLVHFDGDEEPVITFPDHGARDCRYMSIVGNYIYYEWESVKAKNPKLRLSIKKIK